MLKQKALCGALIAALMLSIGDAKAEMQIFYRPGWEKCAEIAKKHDTATVVPPALDDAWQACMRHLDLYKIMQSSEAADRRAVSQFKPK